jgi:ClpP class serine protease
VHDVFIGVVKDRRAAKLKGPDGELFSGAFWSGPKAMDLGLIDGITDMRSKMREIYGDKVQLRVISPAGSSLLGRLRRLPSIGQGGPDLPFSLADDILSSIEARSLWARYGL